MPTPERVLARQYQYAALHSTPVVTNIASAFISASPLIAADGYYFLLDQKVAKNQDRKKLPRTGLYLWPAFLSGHGSFNNKLPDYTNTNKH